MKVNLVGLTQPNYKYTGCTTAQELVAWCARVSNPGNQQNHATGPKLLASLIRDKHWSPLEMVNVAIEIQTTRDIGRQLLRHTFKFQEYSQRYAVSSGFETREARMQDTKNRQNSLPCEDETLIAEWEALQVELLDAAQNVYNWALNSGIAKEQARAVLPEGLTQTTLIASGTLRTWIHYCDLRRRWDSQKEHRELAEACWGIIASEFPDLAAIAASEL